MKANLRLFIEQENQRRRIFKDKLVTVPTCLEDAQWIIEKLESKLSPENLYEDGEISAAEAQEKEVFLLAVHTELEQLIDQEIVLEY